MIEVKFRAPRFDENNTKTEDAMFVEVRFNDRDIHTNAVRGNYSVGADLKSEEPSGPAMFSVEKGVLALRNFSIRRIDLSAIKVPEISGRPTNSGALVDFVKQGEELFKALGCVECHSVQKDDTSVKTGPNLFGLFTLEARERTIASGGEGHRFTIKTDRAYLHRSVRTPADELAIAEKGATIGKAYLPVMPAYSPEVISDKQLDAIGSYLMTLNEPSQQGPVIQLVAETGPENYDPMVDRLQMLVDRSVRIQRGPIHGVSARSIHVGLPNGLSYSFDPRVLGIAKIWQGGFLDMSGEWLNRGGRGLKTGYDSREIDLGPKGVLFVPLNAQGEGIDFSFKESLWGDTATMRASLENKRDHLDQLRGIDAQFLGYNRDSRQANDAPFFEYRVGRNLVGVRTEFTPDGGVRILVHGHFNSAQSFWVNQKTLSDIKVSTGKIEGERWVLSAGEYDQVIFTAKMMPASNLWHAKPSEFNYMQQGLLIEPAKPRLPKGYSAETFLAPKDNYGRDQLFEALGLALAPDGTVVVATRTAGIWRLKDGQWHLFAEGFFDSLGVQVEDEHGLKIVVGQKAELTRVTDTNGDGLADSFETLTDAFSYHGNYHTYLHGPVRAPNGDYFITLNLADVGGAPVGYKAGGKYMGTFGGFSGWAVRVPANGGFEPWADGLRSPAGLAFAPDGRLWYADNQGEYVGTSKIFVLKQGGFYGHPAGLVDRPGMTETSPEITWENVWKTRERAVVLLPQNRLANSPGNPAWDTTQGNFGPFAGQMLIGDQTQSNLLRVYTETIGNSEQGAAITFFDGLESGVMRPLFLPDHSLLLGQTGRGWQSKGGKVASLQRISWDGKTIPAAILAVSAVTGGFEIKFTKPVPAAFSDTDIVATLKIKSWVYRDAPDYGSPELDEHTEGVTHAELSADRTRLHVALASTDQKQVHPQQTARVYQITLNGEKLWDEGGPGFDAFYTLYEFP